MPLGLGKLLASVTSLPIVTVSYAQTLEAIMPLFIVILLRVIIREKQSKAIYLTLIPTISSAFGNVPDGVVIRFDRNHNRPFVHYGQNIFSKKVL